MFDDNVFEFFWTATQGMAEEVGRTMRRTKGVWFPVAVVVLPVLMAVLADDFRGSAGVAGLVMTGLVLMFATVALTVIGSILVFSAARAGAELHGLWFRAGATVASYLSPIDGDSCNWRAETITTQRIWRWAAEGVIWPLKVLAPRPGP